MDSLTQLALGALCGEIILSKKIGYKGMLWGAALGTLPDLDIIAYLWLDAADQLRWHRGVSHSLLSIPIAALLIGWLISKVHKGKNVTYLLAFWFVLWAWGTHIFIDCFNTYGTQILAPFSDTLFSFDVMFIIDPLFTLPLVIGLIACLFFDVFSAKRKWVQYLTVGWLCFYFSFAVAMKQAAYRHFVQLFDTTGGSGYKMMTSPTPLNIFAWRGIKVDERGNFHLAYWSLFDSFDKHYTVDEIPSGREFETKFKESKEFKSIEWFANGWHKTYIQPDEPDVIYIALMKIGEMRQGKAENQLKTPAFLWKITKSGGDFTLTRPFKMSKDVKDVGISASLETLFSRVSGGEPDWMKGKWIWELH